jgi:hypothetical protein
VADPAHTSPARQTLQQLFAGVRAHGAALLAPADDPAAELLALVWGSRFDREHAQGLAWQAGASAQMLHTLREAADGYDRLAPAHQQRLRRVIARHGEAMGQ